MEAFQKKPTGVILLSLFLIVAFTMDFYNGAMMIFGVLPIPPVYTALGISYGYLLLFGGIVGLFLFYGILNLKNWAKVILQIGFPAQVIFNIAIDPLNSDNYILLIISIVVAGYLQLSSTKEKFN
jgi:hypothetical protein